MDPSDRIRSPHLQAALAIWDYCERSVFSLFGDRTGDPVADRILDGHQVARVLWGTGKAVVFRDSHGHCWRYLHAYRQAWPVVIRGRHLRGVPDPQGSRADLPCHFRRQSEDDAGRLKATDFKTEVLFDLLYTLYRRKHGLTVTGNHSLRDLVDPERLHPAIVRRPDDTCRVVEV